VEIKQINTPTYPPEIAVIFNRMQ